MLGDVDAQRQAVVGDAAVKARFASSGGIMGPPVIDQTLVHELLQAVSDRRQTDGELLRDLPAGTLFPSINGAIDIAPFFCFEALITHKGKNVLRSYFVGSAVPLRI